MQQSTHEFIFIFILSTNYLEFLRSLMIIISKGEIKCSQPNLHIAQLSLKHKFHTITLTLFVWSCCYCQYLIRLIAPILSMNQVPWTWTITWMQDSEKKMIKFIFIVHALLQNVFSKIMSILLLLWLFAITQIHYAIINILDQLIFLLSFFLCQ